MSTIRKSKRHAGDWQISGCLGLGWSWIRGNVDRMALANTKSIPLWIMNTFMFCAGNISQYQGAFLMCAQFRGACSTTEQTNFLKYSCFKSCVW